MKSIGIKLADGSFYPILEDGKPEQKDLDLTTVKDNQTIVNIDLYRSESGSVEGAEYVDTLQIRNMKPHPNGEPSLALSIKLDENNILSAEVKDPETGRSSGVTVEMVSRTLAERNAPADFSLHDEAPPEQAPDSNLDDTFVLPNVEDVFDGKAPEPGAEKQGDEPEVPEVTAEPVDFDLPEFDDSVFDVIKETETSERNIVQELLNDDFSVEKDDVIEDTSASQDTDFSTDNLFNEGDFELPDFDDTPFDEPQQDSFETSRRAVSSFAPSGSSFNFTDLYDKETLDGKSYEDDYDKETENDKKNASTIICVVCALICILATVLMLFVLPTRFNLLKANNARFAQENANSAQTAIERPSVSAQTEQVPPSAKEDVIVISPTPKVVPAEPAPKPNSVKKSNVIHTIQWGDTLWDLSETYYRNPWKYQKIAEYNHITNPDFIRSGTKIEIPAE